MEKTKKLKKIKEKKLKVWSIKDEIKMDKLLNDFYEGVDWDGGFRRWKGGWIV